MNCELGSMNCELGLCSHQYDDPIDTDSSLKYESFNSSRNIREPITKSTQTNKNLSMRSFWPEWSNSRINKVYVENSCNRHISNIRIPHQGPQLEPNMSRQTSIESTLNPWFFNNAELTEEYVTYKKQYFHILSQIPNLVILFAIFATHSNFNLLGIDEQAHYLFTVSFILGSVASNLFFVFTLAQVVMVRNWYNDVNDSNGNMRKMCKYVVHKWMWGKIEDVVLLSAALSGTLILIGRVLVGQCPLDDPIHAIWSAQACNPFAVSGGIPLDSVLFVYSIPLGCQTFFTGVNWNALVVSWIAIVTGVVFSVVYVDSPMLIYVALIAVFFMTASFEFERRMRISFLQARLLNETRMREFEYKVTNMTKDHELQILSVSKENEKKLMEAETFQLRGLMGNVAHDLKTPLHSITAELEIMKSDIKSFVDEIGEKIGKDIAVKFENTISTIFESLDGTCHFMTMAINRSQDFMKASSNIALVPHNETFDLAKTIATAVGYIKSVQSGRILVVDPLPPGMCTHIISDKQWLCENLMCFVSNAVKYSDRGAQVNISAAIETSVVFDSVAADSQQSMLHFMVEDTGVGINENARSLLFQPFKQAQRMAGGTGLGLYSLAKRVEALGGSCGVDGRRDGSQGSMFWFKIPYRPDETMSIESSALDIEMKLDAHDVTNHPSIDTSQSSDHNTANANRLSFLVVDDTLTILKMLERVLKQNGHTVKTAENGSQSLELLKKSYETGKFFDVVITDLQMPIMDGFESIRRFREFENAFTATDGSSERHQLVIGMSANSIAQSRQDALDVGMNDFVTKPFKYDDLKTVLTKHLKQYTTELKQFKL